MSISKPSPLESPAENSAPPIRIQTGLWLFPSVGGHAMRTICVLLSYTMLSCMLIGVAAGQSLDLSADSTPAGGSFVSINFTPEGTNVVALQFDLQFNPQKIKMAGLQVMKGKTLSGDHGFEFRQVQPGTVRVVIYPPIRQQMPSLAAGQAVSLKFPELDAIALDDGDIRFVPGSVVLSDSMARAVKLRQASSSLGRNKGRRK